MNRLGVEPADCSRCSKRCANSPRLHVEGIFTHFATSDEADKQPCLAAVRPLSASCWACWQDDGLRPPSPTAPTLPPCSPCPKPTSTWRAPASPCYGLDPDADECPLPDGFRPALWPGRRAWRRCAGSSPGDAVSYGREFIADAPHARRRAARRLCRRLSAPPAQLGLRAARRPARADSWPCLHGPDRGRCQRRLPRQRRRAPGRRGRADWPPGRPPHDRRRSRSSASAPTTTTSSAASCRACRVWWVGVSS